MSRLAPAVRDLIRQEIAEASGREVSFVATVDDDGVLTEARVVARGTIGAVLALPGVAARGEMLVHNHPSGVLEPSQADLSVAAQLADGGIGFAIVDNDAEGCYVVVEVPKAPSYEMLDPVGVADLLSPDSPVSEALGLFEDRPSQRDMAAYITDAYNEGGVSLLEAGTGVGKSFAYLIPAIEWARTNEGERTVVSTNTINLQEQLVGKDLPVLERAYEGKHDLKFALLKGWRNYLCLARMNLARGGQGSLFDDDREAELADIVKWAEHTNDGSLADLADPPSSEVWDEVSAEPDLCTRLECPFYNECFVFAARKRAADADVVVVNHHLLARDIAVRRNTQNYADAAVLPPYKRLILDEAHHIEDTAAKHLGHNVTSTGVVRLLGRLERNGRGLIPRMLSELTLTDDLLSKASIELIRNDVLPAVADARVHTQRLFGLIADTLSPLKESVMRLDDEFNKHPVWQDGLSVTMDNFVAVVRRLHDGVETVTDRLEVEETTDARSQLLKEMRAVLRRLGEVLDGLLLTLRPTDTTSTVRWLERRGTRPTQGLPFPVGLSSVPLDLAPVLKESLFDRIETVILTSATLATGGDFDFLKGRLGLSLPPSRVRDEHALPSPFDFANQCMLGIPSDLPDPRADADEHHRALTTAVMQLAHASNGGMFVLFTSYSALRKAASVLKNQIGGRWPLLVQGQGQRDRLLKRFRESGSAILLGTDSFWEGVDVPGQALRVLIMAKLPFKVPSEPLTAARIERLEQEGGDGFMGYLVPHAALKLKQGFGRLIRSGTDYGVVVLMDKRVLGRSYGRQLIESLPPARQEVGSWYEVRERANEFFAEHGLEVPA